jgi:murein DD-endopeptidase MepM/ murein hydrolase activator NlpD
MRNPIDNYVITSPEGTRILNGVEGYHDGLDLISRENNNVYAILPGKVVHDMDEYIHDERFKDKKHSAGNYLIIKHKFEKAIYYVRYLHLGENTVSLKETIEEGEVIGNYGDYGYSFGAHLHIDVYDVNWKKISITELLKSGGVLS